MLGAFTIGSNQGDQQQATEYMQIKHGTGKKDEKVDRVETPITLKKGSSKVFSWVSL